MFLLTTLHACMIRALRPNSRRYLLDGMDTVWDPTYIAQRITEHIGESDVDAVRVAYTDQILTFDARGVSQHSNHIATYHGARRAQSLLVQQPDLLILHSRSVWTKFGGMLVAVMDTLTSRDDLRTLVTPYRYLRALAAMREHASQLVWFRYLYVMCSTYMHTNAVSYYPARSVRV